MMGGLVAAWGEGMSQGTFDSRVVTKVSVIEPVIEPSPHAMMFRVLARFRVQSGCDVRPLASRHEKTPHSSDVSLPEDLV